MTWRFRIFICFHTIKTIEATGRLVVQNSNDQKYSVCRLKYIADILVYYFYFNVLAISLKVKILNVSYRFLNELLLRYIDASIKNLFINFLGEMVCQLYLVPLTCFKLASFDVSLMVILPKDHFVKAIFTSMYSQLYMDLIGDHNCWVKNVKSLYYTLI